MKQLYFSLILLLGLSVITSCGGDDPAQLPDPTPVVPTPDQPDEPTPDEPEEPENPGIAAEASIRNVLMRIYNECGGSNWEHQENWGSDLSVTEWEGVRKVTEDTEDFKKGTYVFDFMSANQLTGTFAIEECNDTIAFSRCNSPLDGLRLVNCPNLVIHQSFTPLFEAVKSIYIDGINIYEQKPVVEGTTSSSYTKLFFNMYLLEDITIKNCKGEIHDVTISGDRIKNVVCENIDIDYYYEEHEHYTVHSGISVSAVFVDNIRIANNKGLHNIYIDPTNYNENKVIEISNNDVKEIIWHGGGADSLIIRNNYGLSEGEAKYCTYTGSAAIKHLVVEDVRDLYVGSMDGLLESISAKRCTGSFPLYHMYNLKTADIEDCVISGIAVSPLVPVERITCRRTRFVRDGGEYDINIDDCPSLQYLDCSDCIDLKSINFGEGINTMEIHCKGNKELLQELPGNYTGNEKFYYDQRYEYSQDESGEVTAKDKGYGWWYPGEPESGGHHR